MDDWKQALNFEFNLVKWNLTKLTTMTSAVKRSISFIVVKRSTSLVVKRSTSLAVKRSTSLASIQQFIPEVQAHMICGSFVHSYNLQVLYWALKKIFCSSLWSSHSFISVTGAWIGEPWLGSRDLPAIKAVFCLFYLWLARVEAHMGITGTHLRLKRGIWLMRFTPNQLLDFLFEFVHNSRY